MKKNTNRKTQTIQQLIKYHIAPYRAFLIALSGGLDSMVLLDALSVLRSINDRSILTQPLLLRAAYIHHGLSDCADIWAARCAHECFLRKIDFKMTRIVIAKTSRGIESEARSARYTALSKMLISNEVLVTAHHQNDQAETFLLALKRGSGPTGLSSMRTDIRFFNTRLVRPLLECTRRDLEEYAHSQGIKWIEDASNQNLRFDRNFLRVKILPLFEKRWPKFTTLVARSAKLCAEQETLLDELLKETLEKIIEEDGSLNFLLLKKNMSNMQRFAILRRWLAKNNVEMLSHKKITQLWEEVALSRRDSVANIQCNNFQIRRFRDHLYILPQLPVLSNVTLFWPVSEDMLTLPKILGCLYRQTIPVGQAKKIKDIAHLYHFLLSKTSRSMSSETNNILKRKIFKSIVRAPLLKERVTVRFGTVYGSVHVVGRPRGRPLKKIWQEINVPPWRRKLTPLLFYNSQLIAALGAFTTQEGMPKKHDRQWHLTWQSRKAL